MKKNLMIWIYAILFSILPFMANAQDTISVTNTPTNNNGVVTISYNFYSSSAGIIQTYISLDSLSFFNVSKPKPVLGNGNVQDTIKIGGPAVGNTVYWIKAEMKIGNVVHTTSIHKIQPYVVPQIPWVKIDSIVKFGTNTGKVYLRYIVYNQNAILKIAWGLNDTISVNLTGVIGEKVIIVDCPNRVIDRNYLVNCIISNSIGTYKTPQGTLFKIPSVPEILPTINVGGVMNNGLVIYCGYEIPGTANMDLYANIAEDSMFTVPVKNYFFKNISGTGILTQPVTGLTTGTYWVNFMGVYKNNLVLNKAKFVYTAPNGIEDNKENTFSVYPNPAVDFLFIENAPSINQIKIIDLAGNIVKNLNPEEKSQIDVSDLNSGIYILDIDNTRVKFVKN